MKLTEGVCVMEWSPFSLFFLRIVSKELSVSVAQDTSNDEGAVGRKGVVLRYG